MAVSLVVKRFQSDMARLYASTSVAPGSAA